MKKLVGVAAALAIFVSAVPTVATAQTTDEVLPACRDLTQGVRPVDIVAAANQSTCFTAVATMIAASVLIPNQGICLPAAPRTLEVVSLVLQYVSRNPQLETEEFAVTVVTAMMAMWPCG